MATLTGDLHSLLAEADRMGADLVKLTMRFTAFRSKLDALTDVACKLEEQVPR
jgi:hypothetical protein